MTKISDFTKIKLPITGLAYLHVVDVSEANVDDQNKKVQIKELKDDIANAPALTIDSQINILTAAVLTLNSSPVKILDGAVIAPNYNHFWGCVVEYNFASAAYATDTELIITDANGVPISTAFDVLGNTSNKKLFMTSNYYNGTLGNNAHISGNIYITTPTTDPTAGGGALVITPVYREIITF